jgi:hypothetical protein
MGGHPAVYQWQQLMIRYTLLQQETDQDRSGINFIIGKATGLSTTEEQLTAKDKKCGV